jgi:hypothetical protein
MLRLLGAARGDSDCPRAVCDPLAPVIDVIDRAHRELSPRDLAAVLVEVDRLAAVLGARGEHPNALARSVKATHPAPATPAGQAYRRATASTLCECIADPFDQGHPEHTEIGERLDAYLSDVAVQPTGCPVPS